MKKALFVVAFMFYAVWAMAQAQPHASFTALAPGVTLQTEAPGPHATPTMDRPKTPPHSLAGMHSPIPPPPRTPVHKRVAVQPATVPSVAGAPQVRREPRGLMKK